MAYKSANLQQITPRMGTGDNLNADDGGYAVAIWSYRAILADGDNLAAMRGSGFISDADDKGVRVGDIVIFVEDTTAAGWSVVDAITAGAADVTTVA